MSVLKLDPQKIASIKPPYIFLDTAKKDKQNQRSFFFNNIKKVLEFRAGDCPVLFFRQAQNYLNKGNWLCGYFSYEFGYFLEDSFKSLRGKSKEPLAWLAVAARPWEVGFTGRRKNSLKPGYTINNIKPNVSQKEYEQNIEKIKYFLEEGLSYQVNYTFKIKFNFKGNDFEFYQDLRKSQPTAYSAFINVDGQKRFLSLSPELFIRINRDWIKTSPMKGTIKRGQDKREDEKNKKELISSKKNKAENLMIVDLLRNDLAKIAKQVRVPNLFNVERYKTLYQMTSDVEARLRKKIKLKDIFAAVFPSGSVTGAPKIKTMQIISQLEKEPRGIYTGSIGYISPQGRACFNVAIRTIRLNKGKADMGVGGGIVYDSEKEDEYKEALLKADFFIKSNLSFRLVETILWSKEKGFWLLDLHLARLKNSCSCFLIPFCSAKIKKELERKVKRRKSKTKVRLCLDPKGEVKGSVERLNEVKLPVRVKVSSKKVNSSEIFLYHKTTKRGFYDQERKKATREGFFEVIFLNEKKEVTEGTITNVFIEKDKNLCTSFLSCGLLPGVFRQKLLNTGKVCEKKIFIEDLKKADKVYVGNSVRGLLEADIS